MRYIHKIGVELEVGLKSFHDCEEMLKKRRLGHIDEDGSICVDDEENHEAWEVILRPNKSPEKVFEAIRAVYRHVGEVNNSMGLHVHVSLKKEAYYDVLMSYKFYKHFIRMVKETENNKLISRLKGDFSREYPDADTFNHDVPIQANCDDKSSYRYRAINYCYAYHGTIEFRIFNAAETAGKAIEYVELVIRAINSYLSNEKIKKVTARESLRISMKPETKNEEWREKVRKEVTYNV